MTNSNEMNTGAQDNASEEIAIVGYDGRFPGARDTETYWENIKNGVESAVQLSDLQLLEAGVSNHTINNPDYVKVAFPIGGIEEFDADFFGFSPMEADIMDPQHRHFLEVCWKAMEHSGHDPERFDGSIGVFAGSGFNGYLPQNLLSNADIMAKNGFFLVRHTGNDKDFLATRVSYCLNLRGPSVNVATACSTSLVSVHLACQGLINYECDMAIAGGVTFEMPHSRGYLYKEGEILSPDGHCRPFDASSQGTLFGSGAGAVVLRRLEDAIENRDCIHAVIKASAINNDGAGKVSYMAPSVDGQSAAINEAVAIAGIDVESIGYIECHGTGTPIGDPIEVKALSQVFEEHTNRTQFCALGSVKANIGHLDAAAGVAGLIKTVMALKHKEIPPSINFDRPNPVIDFDNSPFYVNTSLTPWLANDNPRRAGVSSLGVGGTNAHVILEEAPERPVSSDSRNFQLILLSAKNADSLDNSTESLLKHLNDHQSINLADAAYTLQTGRQSFDCRRYLVGKTAGELNEHFKDQSQFMSTKQVDSDSTPEVNFMFAGGGSQYPNMGRGLYESEPEYAEAIDECFAILEYMIDFDPRSLLFPGSASVSTAAEELQRPSRSLPMIFVTQFAMARLWMSWGVLPNGLIGHSLGETTAACLSGVISLKDALGLVVLRGQLFETVESSGMISVNLSELELRQLLPAHLDLAAVNAEDLTVVSGDSEALVQFECVLQEKEISSQRIHINIAAHSRLLDPILEPFGAYLKSITLNPPQIRFISNVTGNWIKDEDAISPDYWVSQLRSTVQFSKGVKILLDQEQSVLFEVGPGKTLSSLATANATNENRYTTITSLRHFEEDMHDAQYLAMRLGDAWQSNIAIDWQAYYCDEDRNRVSLTTYAFSPEYHWVEPQGTGVFDEQSVVDEARDIPPSDWFAYPVWQNVASVEEPSQDLANQSVVLYGPSMEAVDHLRREFENKVNQVTIVHFADEFKREGDHFHLNPNDKTHVESLFEELTKQDRIPDRLIYLGATKLQGMEFFEGLNIALSIESFFGELVLLLRLLGSHAKDEGLLVTVITHSALAVNDEAQHNPLGSLVAGAVEVTNKEFTNVSVTHLDLDSDSFHDQEQWIPLALSDKGYKLVALRQGHCYSRHFKPVHLSSASEGQQLINRNGVYLITGGLGGIGFSLAKYLVKMGPVRLALVSRTGLPERKSWDRWIESHSESNSVSRMIWEIRAIEESGSQVIVSKCDIGNSIEVGRLIGWVKREFGMLNGIFHTAGVLDDDLISLKTMESARRVLSPKVLGAINLDEATHDINLDFMVLFSSVSSLIGLAGQIDYASANAFLDCFASYRSRNRSGKTLAVNWSAWQEIGMAVEMAKNMGAYDELKSLTPTPLHSNWFTELYEISERKLVAVGRFCGRDHWILDEHRLPTNEAILPGSGYVSFVLSVYQAIKGIQTISIKRLIFLAPFSVSDEIESELRIEFLWSGEGSANFSIYSVDQRSGLEKVEHARGQMIEVEEQYPIVNCSDELLYGDGYHSREVYTVGREYKHMNFGPRWNCVREIRFFEGEAVSLLELPKDCQGADEHLAAHPALLDIGTACAQKLIKQYDPDLDFYVPLSYGSYIHYKPMHTKCRSHIRLTSMTEESGRTTVSYDVTFFTEQGEVLADIKDFSMIKVDGSAFRPVSLLSESRIHNHTTESFLATLAKGIRPEEGLDALMRAMGVGLGSQIVVSNTDFISAYDKELMLTTTDKNRGSAAGGNVSANQNRPEFVAPRSPIERQIAAILQDLLGVDEIGIHDNFFDLGGHSLLAVRFFAKMNKTTGINPPLSALFAAPTLEKLAVVFGGDVETEAASSGETKEQVVVVPATGKQVESIGTNADVGSLGEDKVWPCLVDIQPSGTRTPIFFIHAIGGNVLNYFPLTKYLGSDRPMYGLQARGLDGRSKLITEVTEMAEQYISEILEVQPRGPYILAGGSMGGVLALEMAHQLKARGSTDVLCIMFDSYGSGYFDYGNSDRDAWPMRMVPHRLHNFYYGTAGKSVDEKVSYLKMRFDQRLAKLRMKKRIKQGGQKVSNEAIYHHIRQMNLKALERYSAPLYDGGVVLFVCEDKEKDVFQDKYMGWEDFVSGRVEVYEVAGDHSELIGKPELGIKLSNLLDQYEELLKAG